MNQLKIFACNGAEDFARKSMPRNWSRVTERKKLLNLRMITHL